MLYVRVRFYGVCAGLACQIHGNGHQTELVKREKDGFKSKGRNRMPLIIVTLQTSGSLDSEITKAVDENMKEPHLSDATSTVNIW
jgi:carbamate kinase